MKQYNVSKGTSLLLDAIVTSNKLFNTVNNESALCHSEDGAIASMERFGTVFKPMFEYLEKRLLSSIIDNLMNDETTI